VKVDYAKQRASVSHDSRTWRMQYEPTGTGFRYVDAGNEWVGSDSLASLRENGRPVAFNCRPIRRTT
jgi:hypothetical protein